MSTRECPACHSSISDDEKPCPVCKMPKISILEKDPAERLKIEKQYGQIYADKILNGLEIGVLARKYREEGSGYVEDGRQYVKLFDCSALKYNEIIWSGYRFGQGNHEQDVTVDVLVKKEEKKILTTVTAPPLGLVDFWYVGATLQEGFQVAFTVGNPSENTTTGQVNILAVIASENL